MALLVRVIPGLLIRVREFDVEGIKGLYINSCRPNIFLFLFSAWTFVFTVNLFLIILFDFSCMMIVILLTGVLGFSLKREEFF